MTRRAVIEGTGAYLPTERISSATVAERLDLTADWIRQRTGIEWRHVASAEETAPLMAARAMEQALAQAALAPAAVDLVVAATVRRSTPGVAARAARLLDLRCATMDVGAACAGFVYALSAAAGQIALQAARNVLVVGVEILSDRLDWEDPATATLFGDGAGAVLLRAGEGERGLQAVVLRGDPGQADALGIRDDRIHMAGPTVYRYAVREVTGAVRAVCDRAGWSPGAVDWLVPHQANARVLSALGRRLDLPSGRIVNNVAERGNTSAASIPIALAEAARDGRLRAGQRVVLAGLGAGLVYGAAALRW